MPAAAEQKSDFFVQNKSNWLKKFSSIVSWYILQAEKPGIDDTCYHKKHTPVATAGLVLEHKHWHLQTLLLQSDKSYPT